MTIGWPDVSFEDRMARSEFRGAPTAHHTVDGDSCRGCTTKACVVACPANLFVPCNLHDTVQMSWPSLTDLTTG